MKGSDQLNLTMLTVVCFCRWTRPLMLGAWDLCYLAQCCQGRSSSDSSCGLAPLRLEASVLWQSLASSASRSVDTDHILRRE